MCVIIRLLPCLLLQKTDKSLPRIVFVSNHPVSTAYSVQVCAYISRTLLSELSSRPQRNYKNTVANTSDSVQFLACSKLLTGRGDRDTSEPISKTRPLSISFTGRHVSHGVLVTRKLTDRYTELPQERTGTAGVGYLLRA
ncbi:hypothetical protein BaRGS_00029066 [Batillaria attramentaria]|uniref:Uncharacterized protein n=1 Tax=Batillaria attramentaria TaxID=370345 RepID=A0ABD0JX35_9CAEN